MDSQKTGLLELCRSGVEVILLFIDLPKEEPRIGIVVFDYVVRQVRKIDKDQVE